MGNWIDIPGFNGRYKASEYGEIKSIDHTRIGRHKENRRYKGKILSQCDSGGYLHVRIFGKGYLSHRLIAIAFIPNPSGKKYVNHKNGNKKDNRVENLEWCTCSENIIHSYRRLNRRHPFKDKKGIEAPIVKHKYIQFDTDGRKVGEYFGVCEAARAIGVHQSGKSIRRAIMRGGTCKGFKWKSEQIRH